MGSLIPLNSVVTCWLEWAFSWTGVQHYLWSLVYLPCSQRALSPPVPRGRMYFLVAAEVDGDGAEDVELME